MFVNLGETIKREGLKGGGLKWEVFFKWGVVYLNGGDTIMCEGGQNGEGR